MTFLSKSDIAFLTTPSKLVNVQWGARQTGNGNWTGIVRCIYDDGTKIDAEPIQNAPNKDDVICFCHEYAMDRAASAGLVKRMN